MEKLTITYGISDSPFGKVLIAKDEIGITDLLFSPDATKKLFMRWQNAIFIRNNRAMSDIADRIFNKKEKIGVHLVGTDFQVKVWNALLDIPEGETSTYSAIAETIGHSKAVRAVGTAIGQNPICYLVPCHRVIRKDGSLGGYSAGIDLKKAILAKELH